jgi:acetyl esterase/lipase
VLMFAAVSIFFPKTYDQTSPQMLPTLFTVHGGGFCIGSSRDDDEWNRYFANNHHSLVISLNYSKAPWAPFPTALHDLEALLLSALADESLPIDRSARTTRDRHSLSRVAVLGFSAGGNLAMGVCQLPSVRAHKNAPSAVVSLYGNLDLSVPAHKKLENRPFKPELDLPRGDEIDGLIGLIPSFEWSYVPYGHDLCDPFLSPAFAQRENLPPFVGLVAAELDILAHESWRVAGRLAKEGADVHGLPGRGRTVPKRRSKDPKMRVCGRRDVARRKGVLEGLSLSEAGDKPDERFAFEENWDDGGVKWLLVPDVVHGFDNVHIRAVMGGEETIKDAELKTAAYVRELGQWLRTTVWGL